MIKIRKLHGNLNKLKCLPSTYIGVIGSIKSYIHHNNVHLPINKQNIKYEFSSLLKYKAKSAKNLK